MQRAHRWRTGTALLALVSSATLFGAVTSATAAPSGPDARALAKAADDLGVPAEKLSIVQRSNAHLALTKVDLSEYKVQAPDGRLVAVSFDKATGALADSEAAQRAEAGARRKNFGKFDAALAARLAQADAGADTVQVAFWVKMAIPQRAGSGLATMQQMSARAAVAQAPLIAAIQALGVAPTTATAAPIVFAKLPATQIRQLQLRDDVIAVDLVRGDAKLMTDDSATSNRYPYAWSAADGTGTRVAVHEDDGVDNVNAALNNATHPVVYWDPANPDITSEGGHATHVAGVIASTDNWRRGGAFNTSQVLSANFHSFGDTAAMVNSLEWAAAQGANAINMSWGACTFGVPDFNSHWVDFEQLLWNTNFVVSSGNQPNCFGSLFVASPSLGWNTLSVGSYYDHDTGLRSDDTFSSFTEFQNPTDPISGRTIERPDVTAMGGEFNSSTGDCFGVETTEVGGGVAASTCGTSFAAPDTAALAADIAQRIGGDKPETVRAIVMAGATHNIVDGFNNVDCASSPIPGDCRDGAGAIDANQSINNVAVPGNWSPATFLTDVTAPTGSNIDRTTTLTAGRPARAVIVWDSFASCANAAGGDCATDRLGADFDLSVIDPSGNVVASSASFQNATEVVDFTPAVSGTYTIRTHVFRFDAGTSTYFASAWNKNTSDAITPITGVTGFTLNTTRTGQTTDKGHSYWDTYSLAPGGQANCPSFLNPETGLEKVYQITTPSSGRITATLSSIVGFPGVAQDVDVVLLRRFGAANNQNGQVVACGDVTLSASAQPAGTYYVVVDGFQGSVANFSLNVGFVSGG
ncbi:hypothetical protein Rhe02_07760 [Rhizocola hellebori]|uniref:Peptidase S8/S53 domain-containing protein n=1 Tax=Rhizocola hellebori TaxID=1392758 RepID=A0A8J3VCM6_9ACTN|nr:S8 family serine peptidase [Rhizocola hellebori]GIH02709.1 hypothetical protein Rhe02_07760 [Rhizocola hellebori]